LKVESNEQKSEVAVTLINFNDPRIQVCFPPSINFDELLTSAADEVFASKVIEFLRTLADVILTDKESRKLPDIIAFGLWCKSLVSNINESTDEFHRKGRGIVFHISPGNVPINFAYSLITGLLSGNKNIVRLPTKRFEQVEFLISKFDSILKSKLHKEVLDRFTLIRYPKEKDLNDYFTNLCDVRVIWGGDSSIREIRQSHLPAKSFDVTFADRFSICVIDSKTYIATTEKTIIAQGFYTDTYLFDQNACTAPHLVIWIGNHNDSEKASQIFWSNLEAITTKRYSIEPLQIMDKLVASARFSAVHPSVKLTKNLDNKIFRFQLDSIPSQLEDFKSHSGLFYETSLPILDELVGFVSKNFQTMTYFGFSESYLSKFVKSSQLRGIDRIVPIGKSLDFSFVWDGHDLIDELSRKVEIRTA
jgi:hypothetical protein